MNKVIVSPEADRDLKGIKFYIANEFRNPSSANKLVRSIVKNLRILEEYAEAGPSVAALTGEFTDLRILVCGNYIAIYKVEKTTVIISRIINAKQDYMHILFGNSGDTPDT